VHRTLSHCIVDEPLTLTEGGVTGGGLSGKGLEREDSRGSGSERSILAVSGGEKVNLVQELVEREVLSSEERLLLII